MTSKVKPAVAIDIGGKKRKLLLDLNAMASFEEVTGKNILSGLNASGLGARELRALLWACLIHQEESLTLKEVGSWITPKNMGEIARQLTEAFSAAMPESDGEDGAPLAGSPSSG